MQGSMRFSGIPFVDYVRHAVAFHVMHSVPQNIPECLPLAITQCLPGCLTVLYSLAWAHGQLVH